MKPKISQPLDDRASLFVTYRERKMTKTQKIRMLRLQSKFRQLVTDFIKANKAQRMPLFYIQHTDWHFGPAKYPKTVLQFNNTDYVWLVSNRIDFKNLEYRATVRARKGKT